MIYVISFYRLINQNSLYKICLKQIININFKLINLNIILKRKY